MCPLRCARRYGSAAWVIHSGPKKFVSICVRASDSESSSMNPYCPYPALLTTMSSRPNLSWAALTAAKHAARLVTSSMIGSRASP